jgi:hypothetical protein
MTRSLSPNFLCILALCSIPDWATASSLEQFFGDSNSVACTEISAASAEQSQLVFKQAKPNSPRQIERGLHVVVGENRRGVKPDTYACGDQSEVTEQPALTCEIAGGREKLSLRLFSLVEKTTRTRHLVGSLTKGSVEGPGLAQYICNQSAEAGEDGSVNFDVQQLVAEMPLLFDIESKNPEWGYARVYRLVAAVPRTPPGNKRVPRTIVVEAPAGTKMVAASPHTTNEAFEGNGGNRLIASIPDTFDQDKLVIAIAVDPVDERLLPKIGHWQFDIKCLNEKRVWFRRHGI